MMEQFTKSGPEAALVPEHKTPDNLESAKTYEMRMGGKVNSLDVLSEGVEDATMRENIKSRLEKAAKIGRQAVAGLSFMVLAHGAFGQEVDKVDVERLDSTPVASASFEKDGTKIEITEEKKGAVLDAAVTVAGETLANEAEKLLNNEKGQAEPSVEPLGTIDISPDGTITLPFGAGSIDLKDPATLARFASKLGGDVGKMGKLASYAQNSYNKVNDTAETTMDTRKAMDLLSSVPFIGKISQLAGLAGKAMDGKVKVEKGEKISAGEVFETVISFIPHAAILMMGINLLKKLPPGEASPVVADYK